MSNGAGGTDVIVLGAGIVGAAAALQLQRRGKNVVLVDRRPPGEETSFGNAGLIQAEAFLPYAFPRDIRKLIRYALNGQSEAHYHLSSLLSVGPYLVRYFLNAGEKRVEQTIRANAPLFRGAKAAHRELATLAGVAEMLRPGGWLQLYRQRKSLDQRLGEAELLAREFGVTHHPLEPAGLSALEPHLETGALAGAIHWTGPDSLHDPHALTLAYVAALERLGGRFLAGDARTLEAEDGVWSVAAEEGLIRAPQVLVCLGPWSTDVLAPLGRQVPMGVKRGYHMHYRPRGNAVLHHPLIDADVGYALAPMTRGIRMTTGAEFAQRDAPPTPVQVDRCEGPARALFPLDGRLDAEPWLGRRPCLPDMVPVMGPVPGHPGLFVNFGHAHHGLTNAAICGQLLAEMMTGAPTFCDPAPYRIDRAYV